MPSAVDVVPEEDVVVGEGTALALLLGGRRKHPKEVVELAVDLKQNIYLHLATFIFLSFQTCVTYVADNGAGRAHRGQAALVLQDLRRHFTQLQQLALFVFQLKFKN